MVEQDDGDYLCDEHGDNTWETRLEAESVMDIAQGGKGFMLPQIQPQLEINTNTAPDNNPVHEAVQFYWGKRCPEHEDGCPTCEAWRQYDNLMVDEMVRARIDPEIKQAITKLVLERNL